MKRILFVTALMVVTSGNGCPVRSGSAASQLNEPQSREFLHDTAVSLNDGLILPGVRIGPVSLGTQFETARGVLGATTRDHVYNFLSCKPRVVTWTVESPNGDVELVETTFDLRNRAVRIKVPALAFATMNGVTNGDTFSAVREKYPSDGMESYLDVGLRTTNNSKLIGYPVYWVDRKAGVAFEFVRLKKDSKWILESVTIFVPGTKFMRAYCTEEDTWVKLDSSDDLVQEEIDRIEKEFTR